MVNEKEAVPIQSRLEVTFLDSVFRLVSDAFGFFVVKIVKEAANS